MKKLKGKAKILVIAATAAAVTAAGYAVERFENDAFITEPVVKEQAVSYVEGDDISPDGRVNINTSDVQILATLDGIGDSLAKRIIDYRENNGSFETVEEIMKVPGISEKKFEDMKEHICVE